MKFVAEANDSDSDANPTVLRARTIGDLFHKCQQRFGCCIGRLVDYDVLNPVWRFARCQGKFASCQTSIVDVTVYWEGK